MNIDTLNAHCRFVLVTNLPLCQGRLNTIHQELALALSGQRPIGLSLSDQVVACGRDLHQLLGLNSRVVASCYAAPG